MKSWWIGIALVAMCVGQSARAQYPPGGLLPKPAPVAPAGGHGTLDQQFMPGPMTGASAPPGPEESLALPCDIPTAWGKGPIPESGFYFHVGSQALMRQRPGSTVVAIDPNGTTLLSTHDIDPTFDFGPSFTFGYLFDDAAIEWTGFYVFNQESSAGVFRPAGDASLLGGQLTVPFANPPAQFVGVNGNGIWNQAQQVREALQYSMGNVELNYRWWSRALTGIEGIVGLRYVNLQERFTIFTDATNTASLPVGASPNLNLASTYMTRLNQNLFMAQTGAEWDMPIRNWFLFGLIAKTAIGGDDMRLTTRLTNAAETAGFQRRASKWNYSSLNEINVFIDLVPLEKMHIRLGYTAMWLLNVGDAVSEVNYNLGSPPPPVIKDNRSIFYHGPMLQVQFLF